jgi:hypothetical protein
MKPTSTIKVCEWCVGFIGGDPVFCKNQARHREAAGRTVVCDEHAEDWMDIWGPNSLVSLETE